MSILSHRAFLEAEKTIDNDQIRPDRISEEGDEFLKVVFVKGLLAPPDSDSLLDFLYQDLLWSGHGS